MKIAQFYDNGKIKIGVIEGEVLTPVDFQGDMIDFIGLRTEFHSSGKGLPMEEVNFAPPITRPSKIIGIAFNYPTHLDESKWKRQIP